MSSFIWGNLNRAVNDPTLIDEAIGEAIAAHNSDPNSHLKPGESLEGHRESAVIDHPAESVVNDKIQANARSYIALVGTGDEGDFDSVASAVAYANSKGGGTIYLAPGEYYLGGVVEMVNGVNIVGGDADNTRIIGGYDSGSYIKITDSLTSQHENVRFENLSFQSTGGSVVRTNAGDLSQGSRLVFRYCSFVGGGEYLYLREGPLLIEDCFIEANGTFAFRVQEVVEVRNSRLQKVATGSACNFFDSIALPGPETSSKIEGCFIDQTGVSSGTLIGPTGYPGWNLLYNRIYNFRSNGTNVGWGLVIGNEIIIANNQVFSIVETGVVNMVIGNYFFVFGTGKIAVIGHLTSFVGNYYNGPYGDFDFPGIVQARAELYYDKSYSTSLTSLNLKDCLLSTITANANKTLTTNVPTVGEQRSVRIRTNSTTSRTISFGAGFRSAGTLSTGTVANREFNVRFESDGSYLWEISRTGAIAI